VQKCSQGYHVIVSHSAKENTISKGAYFSKTYYETQIQGPILSGTTAALTSQVYVSVTLLSLTVESQNIRV
jgi:hypothetical protein